MGVQDGFEYFVPGLPDWVTDEDLQFHFSQFGELVRAIVVKDKGKETSRGFGYVTMASASSRDKIVTDMHDFGGKLVRALVTKDSLATSDVKKVHLGNLPPHISVEAIRQAFSAFGAVLDVHTPKDPATAERKNFGFVTFSSDDAFKAALAEGVVNVDGCPILVRPAAQNQEGGSAPSRGHAKGKGGQGSEWDSSVAPSKGRGKGCWDGWDAWGAWDPWLMWAGKGAGASSAPAQGASSSSASSSSAKTKKDGIKYFVPGLPESIRNDDLHNYFKQFGAVVDAAVVTEKGTEQSRGFGYVTMADASSQDALLKQKHDFGGKLVQIMLTKDSLAEAGVRKIHLGQLREDIPADAIRDVFVQFGSVLDVHTPKDPKTGERRNYGFVTFGTDAAFEAALSEQAAVIDGCRVTIKPAAQSSPHGAGESVADPSSGSKGAKDTGKGKGLDPWSWDSMMGKSWGKGWGDWDPWGMWGWGGKGYGKDMWSMWSGKGDMWGGDPWSAAWAGNVDWGKSWGKDGKGCSGKADSMASWGGKGSFSADAWSGKSWSGCKNGKGFGPVKGYKASYSSPY